MAKGGQGERDTADQLSLWWTGNEKESVFWRSSQSGGRATVRARKGMHTGGHHGDIASTDPRSAALTKVVIIECKKGYPKTHLSDLLDMEIRKKKPPNMKILEEWIVKNESACRVAKVPFWVIIHRRSGRVPFIYFSDQLYRALHDLGCIPRGTEPFFRASIRIRIDNDAKHLTKVVEFAGMRFDDFLYFCSPKDFKLISKRYKQ